MKVGLIGIGELGTAVGQNMLRAGYELYAYDKSADAIARLVAQGAAGCESAAVLAAQVDAVVTVLPNPPIIEEVMLGGGGVLKAMRPGSVWIDHSTNDRGLLQCIEQEAAECDIAIIEAPVTGGIPLAYEGKITVLAGTKRETFDKYRPLLAVTGDPVIYMGAVGSASIVKVMTNMLAFIHLWALGEGLMFGTAAGLETGAVYEAIKASCGNSFVAETEGPPILQGNYDYGFILDLAQKDMRLTMDIARENNVPLEMGGLVQQIMMRASAKYGGDSWSTGIVKLLEDDMGIDLRADGYGAAERWLPYERTLSLNEDESIA